MSIIRHSAQSVFIFFIILALVLRLHPRKAPALSGTSYSRGYSPDCVE